MLPFKLIYTDDYYLPIGSHVFPAEKYQRVHKRLLETGVAAASDFLAPQPASDQDILLVHTPQYVHKLKTGTLSAREELEMEIPYSPELVRAFWLAAGGSILAADYALNDGCAINIGGGFHHAFPDHGEGFCMIHDVAIAIRRMQRDDKIRTAMTLDCDVHQGNGTAAIFEGARGPGRPLPSTRSTTIPPGSRLLRSTSTCPTKSATRTISPGSTMPSALGCASSNPNCFATSPAPTPTGKTSWAGSASRSQVSSGVTSWCFASPAPAAFPSWSRTPAATPASSTTPSPSTAIPCWRRRKSSGALRPN